MARLEKATKCFKDLVLQVKADPNHLVSDLVDKRDCAGCINFEHCIKLEV